MADQVVIVDDSGVEHEFPAGFDPKRAAAIVRGQSKPQYPSFRDMPHEITDTGGPAPGEKPSAFSVEGLVRNPLIHGAAQPQDLSDILSLVIPSGVSTATSGLVRGLKSAWEAGSDAKPGMLQGFRRLATGAYRNARDIPLIDPAPGFETRAAEAAEKVYRPSTSIPKPPQLRWPEEVAPVGSKPSPPNLRWPTAPKEVTPKPTQVKPPAVRWQRPEPQASKPTTAAKIPGLRWSEEVVETTPKPTMVKPPAVKWPDVEAIPEPTKPRPPQLRWSEAPEGAPPPKTPTSPAEELAGKFGSLTEIDPETLTPQDWLDLRGRVGAEEASRLTGVPAAQIRLLAPGPSRIPSEAQGRMLEKQLMDALAKDKP